MLFCILVHMLWKKKNKNLIHKYLLEHTTLQSERYCAKGMRFSMNGFLLICIGEIKGLIKMLLDGIIRMTDSRII